MTHTWILDVLTDLKAFALKNDLPVLSGQLDQASIVASAEIASKTQSRQRENTGWTHGEMARTVSGGFGSS